MANHTPPPEPRGASEGYPGTPRWVKVIGIVALAILLLAAFIVVTGIGGPHGPQRHGASADSTIDLVSYVAAR